MTQTKIEARTKKNSNREAHFVFIICLSEWKSCPNEVNGHLLRRWTVIINERGFVFWRDFIYQAENFVLDFCVAPYSVVMVFDENVIIPMSKY